MARSQVVRLTSVYESVDVGVAPVLVGLGFAALTACAAGRPGQPVPSDESDEVAPPMDEPAVPQLTPGPKPVICVVEPDEDFDGDGFSELAGDCNDCDRNVNPHAVEVLAEASMDGAAADEDCDGQIDEPPEQCDSGLSLDSEDPFDAARALGLCSPAVAGQPGLVSASYVRASGAATIAPGLQAGLTDRFGPHLFPRAGERMLLLSSGTARSAEQPGYVPHSYEGLGPGQAPLGFPQPVGGCATADAIVDDVALELSLRAPSNATGWSYAFSFYTREFPEWVCTAFNDQFIALVSPPPPGSQLGNVSFDDAGNPVSVNIAHFAVCSGCAEGALALVGSGFEQSDAATGWLETTVPVLAPYEELVVRLAIWDAGDAAYDSTVVIDDFRWLGAAGTVAVGTQPIPH